MLAGRTGTTLRMNGQTRTDQPTPPAAPGPARIAAVLWESALQSLVRTILILAFGSAVIGVLGGVLKDMVPSAPPGLSGDAPSVSRLFSHWNDSWSWLQAHRFLIVFFVLFGLTVRMRLAGRAAQVRGSSRATRTRRIGRRISQDWFGVIIGNAFAALISATVFVGIQQFSGTSWLLHSLWSLIGPAIQTVSNAVLGPARVDALQGWLDWYNQNQLKFVFWAFYLAAVCDDLGIPNWKTLLRWVWRKSRRHARRERRISSIASETSATARPSAK